MRSSSHNIALARTLVFGFAKVLSGSGIVFFLVNHGLLLFGVAGVWNETLSFVSAFSMGYVVLFTQVPPMYRSQMPPNKSPITLLHHHPIAVLSGYLQALCVGLNAFLGCYTLLQAFHVNNLVWLCLISAYAALSNAYAYYGFVMPKLISNSVKYRQRLQQQYISSKSAFIKTLVFSSTGLIAYSFLALYSTYNAMKLFPVFVSAAMVMGLLSFYATFSTFILSRIPAVYDFFNKQAQLTVHYKATPLLYSHYLVGGMDIISFCFVSYTGALLSLSILFNGTINPLFYILFLLPAASAAFLHSCFSILRMLEPLKCLDDQPAITE